MATAFYRGTYPCCHGNPKSRRALRQGEATGGADQWTGWRVFQNPGRRRKATKKREKRKKQTCLKKKRNYDCDHHDKDYLLLCMRILLLRSTQLSLPGSMCNSVFLVPGWPWNKRLSWTTPLTGPSTAMPHPRAG